jgi:hypothetical protein
VSPCLTEQEATSTHPPQEMLSIAIVPVEMKCKRSARQNI